MSSLAAARADNFYYPKDWRPENGSLNTFHGSHALGKRAKDLATDGVLVVRFEMPFNVWCLHCDSHIGRGVRFNARKKNGEMVVETDPEHRGYKLVSGVKKQTTAADDEQNDNSPEERGVEQLNESHVGHRAAEDPFFRLEHEHHDKEKAKQRARGLEAVVQLQDQQFKDDFKSNAALRATFRKTKHHLQANARRANALGLGIPLLDANEDDIARSKATVFQGIHNKKRKESDKAGRRDGGNEDPFQFFGEEKASKLHQLKYKKREQNMAKRISGGATATLHKTSVDRVHARAKKLLARR